MENELVEVRDVGLVDRVSRNREWSIKQDDGKVTSRRQCQQHPIPEEYMSALEPHIGDAQAKVTVGAELGHSRDYGCKATAFVSISVTCNNHEDSIRAVHSLIHPLARKLVNEDLTRMKEDRDAHLVGVGKVSAQPRANTKAAMGPKPGAPRPTFRR
jgi:hypothetical protein